MRYNVAQLLKEHIGGMRHYQLRQEIAELAPSLKPLTDLTGNVDMIRTHDGILVRADLRTSVELACSRCLTQFSLPVRFKLDEEFLPLTDINTGARLPLPDDADEAAIIDSNHILDLSEIVRQDLMLALPLVPLCRSECKGLCSRCGQNWNNGACECNDSELDPRLAALKQLLDDSDSLN